VPSPISAATAAISASPVITTAYDIDDSMAVEQLGAYAALHARNHLAHHPLLRYADSASHDAQRRWESVKPPRIAKCPLQLEAKVTAIHEPATRPDGAYFRIAEAQVQRVHALSGVVKPGTSHIDPAQWRPLLYVFRHYFSTGKELARSFRAED
jgi:flavin reductase (DIM6/NTAB) family NADH-FMN oxidoreductase RutF